MIFALIILEIVIFLLFAFFVNLDNQIITLKVDNAVLQTALNQSQEKLKEANEKLTIIEDLFVKGKRNVLS